MKQKDFIKKVLKSKRNTVFVNKEQVLNALQIFESLGMKPPAYENPEWHPRENCAAFLYEWEEEISK